MLPDWPHVNNECCFNMDQLAQWRPPRSYSEILNSNLLSGKSMVTELISFAFLFTPWSLTPCFYGSTLNDCILTPMTDYHRQKSFNLVYFRFEAIKKSFPGLREKPDSKFGRCYVLMCIIAHYKRR